MSATGPVTAPAGAAGSGDLPSPKPAWYRRRAAVVGAVVAVVLAVTVVSDLPQHTSIAQQISDETTVIGEIKTDASSCIFAVKEAFGFYSDERNGTLTASDRTTLPGLLASDQAACSFTNEDVYDLSNIEVPGGAAGRDMGEVVNSVTLWVTSDALAAITAIISLTTQPTNAAQLRALAKAERYLASDRTAVASEIHSADVALDGANLLGPGLPSLPLPASGS
ncbi:MAG: hypothetical protein WAL04_19180 [Acidimicrobiales bacterium]|jgi:hypothetical protein